MLPVLPPAPSTVKLHNTQLNQRTCFHMQVSSELVNKVIAYILSEIETWTKDFRSEIPLQKERSKAKWFSLMILIKPLTIFLLLLGEQIDAWKPKLFFLFFPLNRDIIVTEHGISFRCTIHNIIQYLYNCKMMTSLGNICHSTKLQNLFFLWSY